MAENTLRMYMVHDGEPAEMAVLVFARTAREARRIASLPWDSHEWTARRAEWLREPEFAYLRAAAQEEGAHTVDSPPGCKRCELWGTGPLDDEQVCAQCRINEEAEAAFA